MCGFRRLRIVAFTLVVLGFSSVSLRASEFYYVLIFGSQPHPKQLRYSHTWATFVRAVGEGPDANNYAIEAHTISWMPASLDVKVFSPTPEPGVNLTLNQTLQMTQSHSENVTLWGPFQIGPQIYQRSLEVRRIIESGVVEYRAISTARNLLISDCIHAVAAVDPIFGRRHYPLIRIGNSASRYIARQASQRTVIDQSQGDNEWLIDRLGLNRQAIRVIPPSAMPRR
jgi:hypothetical protein